jgi:Flp pilus assembly protein CpaB
VVEREFYDHPGWRWCTAQGARDHVLLLGLQTTFREKLEWLEEAATLALRLRANREKQNAETRKAKKQRPEAGRRKMEIRKREFEK